MARKRKEPGEPKAAALRLGAALKWAMRLLPAALAVTAVVVVFNKVESYLISSPRFRLPESAEYGGPSPGVRIHGLRNASLARVLDVFAEDAGRSLYLFDPEERRLRLLAIDWVRNARVARIWPNRVEVFVQERQPVAYALLRGRRGRARTALIDADGVLLPMPERAGYDLPVLRGLSEKMPEAERAARVRLVQRMLEELGPLGEGVSEIDVGDPRSLTIRLTAEGDLVTLIIGARNFRRRLENFLAHYPEIHRRLPAARTFDLRLDDRITARDGITDGDIHANRRGS